MTKLLEFHLCNFGTKMSSNINRKMHLSVKWFNECEIPNIKAAKLFIN